MQPSDHGRVFKSLGVAKRYCRGDSISDRFSQCGGREFSGEDVVGPLPSESTATAARPDACVGAHRHTPESERLLCLVEASSI